MTISGSMGRWHGGVLDHDGVISAKERAARVELARHETMLTEWLAKRDEANFSIKNHRATIKKLREELAIG